MTIYTADKIFTGTDWLERHAIIIEDELIKDILPIDDLKDNCPIHFNCHMIAPSFIDLQIYGAGGRLLAVYPEPGSLAKLHDYCMEGGANHFLPTVATNTYETFYKAIDAVKKYWAQKGQGALGLHIEGPWINPVKRGAHIESLIHSPSLEQASALLEYGKGIIKMITLAPEVCSGEVIDLILSYGIIISAGHSNATYAEAMAAFNKMHTATHLFNAMSPLNHREPGLPAAVMNHPKVMCSIIPDNIHVNFAVVALAKKVMGERLFIITDAVTETDEGPYPHYFEGDKYTSGGILSGSALNMMKAVKNCVNEVGIDLTESLRMAGYYPAKAINRHHDLGIIKKGIKANLVFTDEELNVLHF